MSKFNRANLYGMVLQSPKNIKKEDEQRAVMPILIVHGARDSGGDSKQVSQDVPVIMTRNKDIIKIIETLNPNDMVFIKGVIVTMNVTKGTICPNCSTENQKNGTLVYIEPIYIEKRESNLTQSEAMSLLYERKEISNELIVVGNLCNDPKKVPSLNKATIAQYQIAIPRTFRIKEQPDELDTDFPWVKSYGQNAKEDLLRIHEGSSVLINGYIQANSYPRKATCSHCNTIYTWKDNYMEIIPYETEYLRNYITDEELEALKRN